jgi:uncharacterized protein DUF5947
MQPSATPSPSTSPSETCDFCHALLAETHQHLMECATRNLECVCDTCAILFSGQAQKYRRVPRRSQYLPKFHMTDEQWAALMIPIGIAFLFRRDASGRIAAFYPSPAGPVESLLTLEAWEDIARDNPEVRSMETDVEGLLIYRVGSAREHYIVPIDECFKLVGIIRLKWKGFSGGMIVWQEIGKFLERLKRRSAAR